MPDPEFILYVDEAGDAGVRPLTAGNGSTPWFAMGGIVVAKRHEPLMADWVRAILSGTGQVGATELHYNQLDERQRLLAAQAVAALPLSAFVVLSHKENMRGHRNRRAERANSRNVFYNFCLRVLLERVTHTVARTSEKRFGDVRMLKTVIAQTGGVRYEHTMRYIEKLRAQAITGTTFLDTKVLHPRVVSSWQFETVSAQTTAGCQIADVVVSSFYNAVNERGAYPLFMEPAEALMPVVPRESGNRARHGLTLLPWSENIPENFRPIFRHYGYRL